jgi:hypothetical protein
MNEKPGNLAEVRRQLSVGDIVVDDYALPLWASQIRSKREALEPWTLR